MQLLTHDNVSTAGYGPHSENPRIERVRQLSFLLDSCFTLPGTSFRFGLDPILTLFPGLGDTIDILIGLYILSESRALGASGPLLARMILNLAADGVLGALPFAGSLFNAGFKAHRRNLRLLEAHLLKQGHY